MAQRNPMNERYQGDGPQGKTRKSAAKLKPKTEAASSVHIEKKPQTKQERKAARKKRDAQLAAKEKERQRKAAEREKQARIAAGEEIEEPKKATMGEKVKSFIAPAKPDVAQTQTKEADQDKSKEQGQSKEQAQQAARTRAKGPDTEEYRRLKRIYWTLMGTGVVAIIISFVINFNFQEVMDGWAMMIPMGIAYAAVIGAIILDYSKIRKLQKAHMGQGDNSKKSPKQLKHEQQKAEAAALLEESKKAQKELKRANSKNPFVRKPKEVTAKGEEDLASKTSDDEIRDAYESIEKVGSRTAVKKTADSSDAEDAATEESEGTPSSDTTKSEGTPSDGTEKSEGTSSSNTAEKTARSRRSKAATKKDAE